MNYFVLEDYCSSLSNTQHGNFFTIQSTVWIVAMSSKCYKLSSCVRLMSLFRKTMNMVSYLLTFNIHLITCNLNSDRGKALYFHACKLHCKVKVMIAFCIDNINNIYLREINNGIICIKQKFFLLITPRIIFY